MNTFDSSHCYEIRDIVRFIFLQNGVVHTIGMRKIPLNSYLNETCTQTMLKRMTFSEGNNSSKLIQFEGMVTIPSV